MRKNLWIALAVVAGILVAPFVFISLAALGIVMLTETSCPKPEVISKEFSPHHRYVAYKYLSNCGPWDDWVYHLSVVKADEKLENERGNAFMSSDFPPEIEWKSSDQLIVKYDPNQKRISAADQVEGVRLIYKKCVPKVLFEKSSPNDVHTAYIYERSCGSNNEPKYHLSIINNGYESLRDEPGNVFQSSEPFSVEWKMPGILVVRHDPRAKTALKETKFMYIDILYEPEKKGKK